MKPRTINWLPLAVGALLSLLVLAVGGVHHTTALMALTVALVMLLALCFTRKRVRFPVDGWPWLLGTIFCLLQLVPWPSSWISALAPAVSEAWFRAGSNLSQRLTHASPETISSLSRFAVLMVLSIVAAASVRRRKSLRLLATIVVLTALGSGLLACLQWIIGAEPAFGLYSPATTREFAFSGPFVSPNHFGVFSAFATMVAFGLSQAGTSRDWRALAWLACAVLTALSGSLGAFCGLVVGHVAALLIVRVESKRTLAVQASVIVFAGAVAWLASSRDMVRALEPKLETIYAALGVAVDNPLIGAGAGSFAVVSVPYFGDVPAESHSFPESDWATLMSDFGFVGGSLIMLAVLAVLLTTFRGSRQRGFLHVGVFSGLVSVLFASLLSFNLIALGVVAPVVALVAGSNALLRDKKKSKGTGLPRVLVAMACVLGLSLVGWAFNSDREPPSCSLRSALSAPEPSCVEGRLAARPTEARALILASAMPGQYDQELVLAAAERYGWNDTEVVALAGWLRGSRGEVEPAVVNFSRALQLSDTVDTDLVVLVLDGLRTVDARIEALVETPWAFNSALHLLRQRQEGDWAFLLAQTAWTTHPDMTTLVAVVTQSREFLGSHQAAIGFAREGISVVGDEARFVLVRALRYGNQIEEALQLARQILLDSPHDFFAAQELVLLWLDHDQSLPAIRSAEVDGALRTLVAEAAAGGDRESTVTWLRARVAEKRGQTVLACELFRQLISEGGDSHSNVAVPVDCTR